MKSFRELVAEHAKRIREIMPWDLVAKLRQDDSLLLVDIREADEFSAMHILNSINVPRGILESSCDYNYSETIPELVTAREKEIIVLCRSGNRSVMAASTMLEMGYKNIASLKTGLKGWNDYDQPLIDKDQKQVNPELADEFLNPKILPEQMQP